MLLPAFALLLACNAAPQTGDTQGVDISGATTGGPSGVIEEPTVDIVIEDSATYLSEFEAEPDRLVVEVLPGSLLDVESIAKAVGASVLHYEDRTRTLVLHVPADELIAAATSLAGMPEIEQIERDTRLPEAAAPTDPFYVYQWALPKIHAEDAWNVTTGDASVVVAVVDSGIDVSHPDLRPRLVPGYNLVSGNSDANDCCGHGTEVAGVIGAIANNTIGIAGVAWNGGIMPVRVAQADGAQVTASPSTVAGGILWAVDHGAAVINVSFSGVLNSPAIQTACQYAFRNGRLVVAATGNTSARDSSTNSPWTVSVSATDSFDERASFSTYGPGVDLAAPGVNILTTAMGGDYLQVSGTSFSSPLTAGVVALMWSLRPKATPPQIVELLLNACDPLIGRHSVDSFGRGRLNAAEAVRAARDAVLPADTTPPTVRFLNPAAGAHVGGKVRVDIEGLDDGIVREVVLKLDGVEVARDPSTPYAFLLDTRTLAAGQHTLTASAQDTSSNRSADAALDVAVDPIPDTTAPEVTMLTPGAGTTVSGRVDVSARLADPEGLARVALLLDGQRLIDSAISGSVVRVKFSWNASAKGVKPGVHVIAVTATNRAGLASTSPLPISTGQ